MVVADALHTSGPHGKFAVHGVYLRQSNNEEQGPGAQNRPPPNRFVPTRAEEDPHSSRSAIQGFPDSGSVHVAPESSHEAESVDDERGGSPSETYVVVPVTQVRPFVLVLVLVLVILCFMIINPRPLLVGTEILEVNQGRMEWVLQIPDFPNVRINQGKSMPSRSMSRQTSWLVLLRALLGHTDSSTGSFWACTRLWLKCSTITGRN